MKARIKFRKYGALKFIGHLDVMRYFQKVMRRADIPIQFTGGYSPHMVMSFAQPLGIGLTSSGEYLDIGLAKPISPQEAVKRMNEAMVEGIDVLSFVEIPEDKKQSGMAIVAAASYQVFFLESAKSSDIQKPVPENIKASVDGFLEQQEVMVRKKTKKSEKEVDIRPMIYQMQYTDTHLSMLLAAGSENNLKPDLVMEAFLGFAGEKALPLHYHRTDLFAEKSGVFIPLDRLGSAACVKRQSEKAG